MAMLCGQRENVVKDDNKNSATRSKEAPPQQTMMSGSEGPALASVNQVNGVSEETENAAILRVRLHNPHNLCYMNAGVLAMLHALQVDSIPRGLRPLRDAVLHAPSGGLTLSAHFALRSLFQGWVLDRRQRDVAEFTDFVLSKVGYVHVHWEARTIGRGVHSTVDSGYGILYLDLPSSACDLQELVSAWSDQSHIHALTAAVGDAPVGQVPTSRQIHGTGTLPSDSKYASI